MKLLLSFVAALLFGLQDPPPTPTPLTFIPPKDAKPADVEKAAKAIEKRCAEFGYKGVTAKVAGGGVDVACATGITPSMQSWIEHFATIPAAKVEIAFEYMMSDIERQQFEAGKTSPPKTSWATVLCDPAFVSVDRAGKPVRLGGDDWKLFRDQPRIKATGSLKWVKPDAQRATYFELSGAAIKPFKEVPKDIMLGMQILVDGRATLSGGAMLKYPDAKSVQVLWTSADVHVGICINNPLPFALEPKR